MRSGSAATSRWQRVWLSALVVVTCQLLALVLPTAAVQAATVPSPSATAQSSPAATDPTPEPSATPSSSTTPPAPFAPATAPTATATPTTGTDEQVPANPPAPVLTPALSSTMAASATGAISGIVTGPDGLPVPGVSVYVEDGPSEPTLTDAQGAYTVSDISASDHLIYFDRPFGSGLQSEYYNGVFTHPEATAVWVIAGQTTTGIDASLVADGMITGRVTDLTGQPIPGVAVSVESGSFSPDVWTDDAGYYEAGGLAPGSYVVHFTPDKPTGLLAEYYDDAMNPTSATPVTVTPGQTTAGIDAALAPAAIVRGDVTTTSGAPVAGATVAAYSTTGAGGVQAIAQTTTDGDGSYTIAARAGTYVVAFTPQTQDNLLTEYYDDSADFAGATPVTVAVGHDAVGIDAQLTAAGSITGMVTGSDGAPVAGAAVEALSQTGGLLPSTVTDAEGHYTLTAIPDGAYVVRFTPAPLANPAAGLLIQYYSGATTVEQATRVQVVAGQVTDHIDAALSAGGSITGTVTDAQGLPVPDVTVYPRHAAGGTLPYATTGPDGTYVIEGLPTGDYTVIFNPSQAPGGLLSEFYDNAPTPEQATLAHVAAGQATTGIDAALAAGGSIEGTVTANSVPVPSALVYAFSWATGYSMTVTTDGTGNYQIPALPTGSYTVRFVPMPATSLGALYYKGAAVEADATPVAVTAGTPTTGIDAALAPVGASGTEVTVSIIGGTDAPTSAAPWQVSLNVPLQCGGSLIAPQWVITAAHCINPSAEFVVFAGSATRSGGISRPVPAAQVYVHPGYNNHFDPVDQNWANDVALLKLATAYDLAAGTIEPIALPFDQDPATWPTMGTPGQITGWGDTDPESVRPLPNILQGATIDVLRSPTSFDCGAYSSLFDPASMLCAGLPQGGAGTCYGDSGGPLVINGVLAGITSWVGRCGAPNDPSVFTRVTSYLDWIVPGRASSIGAVAGDARATITVAPPARAAALPILGWLLFESVGGGPYQPVTDTLQTAATFTRTGLTNGHSYRYAVRYYNDVNVGTTQTATAYSTAVTPVGPTPTPPTPTPPAPTPPTPAPPDPTPPGPIPAGPTHVADSLSSTGQEVPTAAIASTHTPNAQLAATGANVPLKLLAALGVALLLLGSLTLAATRRKTQT